VNSRPNSSRVWGVPSVRRRPGGFRGRGEVTCSRGTAGWSRDGAFGRFAGAPEAVRDQTPHVETSVAGSVDSTAPPVIRALAQLSATLIMLATAGEVGHARAVHEAIGELLPPLEGSRSAEQR